MTGDPRKTALVTGAPGFIGGFLCQRLIDEGYSTLHGKRYREATFTLADASVDGRQLVLDVAPLNDDPPVLFDLVTSRSLSFATCA